MPHHSSRTPTDLAKVPANTDPDEDIAKAAIYARTSDSKPKFHYSITEQVAECWNRCEDQGWEVVFVFTDEDISGTNTDRPGFQELIDRAKDGLFDVVIFWKLDRFSRSLTDLVRTEETLREQGVALQSVTEYLDTTSSVGRFTFRNLASAAELESDLTSERVKMGFRGLAKQERWPNDTPPLGYELDDQRRLMINEDEAELVRRIFRAYLREKSMPSVAFQLNQRGRTTKNGDEWSRWTVRKVLTNEIYRGNYRVAHIEKFVEEYQIVSDELFERATQTRHRFRQDNGSMNMTRKTDKAERILDQFKESHR